MIIPKVEGSQDAASLYKLTANEIDDWIIVASS